MLKPRKLDEYPYLRVGWSRLIISSQINCRHPLGTQGSVGLIQDHYKAYVENIDENGNIEIEITENNDFILQSFTVKASRKKLNRLKEVAAYNVGQCLCSEDDVNWLNLPKTLEKLVKKFVNTFSGDYINDLYEN